MLQIIKLGHEIPAWVDRVSLERSETSLDRRQSIGGDFHVGSQIKNIYKYKQTRLENNTLKTRSSAREGSEESAVAHLCGSRMSLSLSSLYSKSSPRLTVSSPRLSAAWRSESLSSLWGVCTSVVWRPSGPACMVDWACAYLGIGKFIGYDFLSLVLFYYRGLLYMFCLEFSTPYVFSNPYWPIYFGFLMFSPFSNLLIKS